MGRTRSKDIISALKAKNPEVHDRGFAKALGKLSDSSLLQAAARAIIPDGYEMRHADCELVIYEVADTNPIRPAKAERIGELADEMDEACWSLRVVVLDYMGHVVADLPGWAYSEAYTSDFAPDNCLDMTPAAKAAVRRARAATPA